MAGTYSSTFDRPVNGIEAYSTHGASLPPDSTTPLHSDIQHTTPSTTYYSTPRSLFNNHSLHHPYLLVVLEWSMMSQDIKQYSMIKVDLIPFFNIRYAIHWSYLTLSIDPHHKDIRKTLFSSSKFNKQGILNSFFSHPYCHPLIISDFLNRSPQSIIIHFFWRVWIWYSGSGTWLLQALYWERPGSRGYSKATGIRQLIPERGIGQSNTGIQSES